MDEIEVRGKVTLLAYENSARALNEVDAFTELGLKVNNAYSFDDDVDHHTMNEVITAAY